MKERGATAIIPSVWVVEKLRGKTWRPHTGHVKRADAYSMLRIWRNYSDGGKQYRVRKYARVK
jgi:hypothetical protein